MIGCAIGGDGNCVNGVIITNLEAISSRPDQSEDAPPFPEPGPFPLGPLARNGNRIFEQLVFKSREPFAAPSTLPSSPSPLHFPPSSLCATLVSLLSSPSGCTQEPAAAVVPQRLPCRPIPPFRGIPLPLYCAKRLPVRWGGTTSENLRRRSLLAFAHNNDLFYDSDFSPAPSLPLHVSLAPSPGHASDSAAGAKFQSNLAKFQDFRYEQRYDTSSCRFRAIFLLFALSPSDIAHRLRESALGAHLVAGYTRTVSLSLSLYLTHTPMLRLITSGLFLLSSPLIVRGFFLLISISHAVAVVMQHDIRKLFLQYTITHEDMHAYPDAERSVPFLMAQNTNLASDE